MKVKYIKCMDFVFEDVEIPDYANMIGLNKAIEDNKMICVKSPDGDIDYVNSTYIMYVEV